jgi:cell division protein FtsB
MDYWRFIYRLAWALLVIVIPIGIASIFAPRCNNLHTLQKQKELLAEGNRQIDERARELQTRQERFISDPLFVERVAREAGMVRSNEVVFRVSPDNPAVIELAPSVAPPATNRASRGTSSSARTGSGSGRSQPAGRRR